MNVISRYVYWVTYRKYASMGIIIYQAFFQNILVCSLRVVISPHSMRKHGHNEKVDKEGDE